MLLRFGAVDYEAVVSVNGAIVGAHRGGSSRFLFDVTDYLRPGDNELVVQVTDATSTGAQPRGKQQLKPEGIWYTPVTGIWQRCGSSPYPRCTFEDLRVTPDIDAGTLKVGVALNHSAADTDAVRITARAGGHAVASVTVRANRPATLPIANARLWSPDDPFLYDLDVAPMSVPDPVAPVPGGTSPHGSRGDLVLTAREAALYAAAPATGAGPGAQLFRYAQELDRPRPGAGLAGNAAP